MNIMGTKARIFYASAELFANKCYADVSVRDIAEAVQIKAASIYNHYASKEEILDDLLNYYEHRIERYNVHLDEYIRSCDGDLDVRRLHYEYGEDDIVLLSWIGRIIINEQFRHPKAASLMIGDAYQRYVQTYTRFFDNIRRDGVTLGADSRMYAEALARLSLTFSIQYNHLELYSPENVGREMDVMYDFIFTCAVNALTLKAQQAADAQTPAHPAAD